jgi:hypothetical protein
MTQRIFGESDCPVDNFLSPLAHLKGRGFMMFLVVLGGAIAVTGLMWGLLALEGRLTSDSEGEWGYL